MKEIRRVTVWSNHKGMYDVRCEIRHVGLNGHVRLSTTYAPVYTSIRRLLDWLNTHEHTVFV